MKRIHNYPFMIYDMYSRPEPAGRNIDLYVIRMDGDTIDLTALPIYAEGRIIRSLRIYEFHVTNGKDYWSPALESRQARWMGSRLKARSDRLLRNRASNVRQFPAWLHDHLGSLTGHRAAHLEVMRVRFDPGKTDPAAVYPLIDHRHD